MVKAGFYGTKRVQRWKCQQCGKRFSDPAPDPLNADVRLPEENDSADSALSNRGLLHALYA
jgi:transposase-like protein